MIDALEDLIRQRVIVTEKGCWEWQGYRTRGGYGRITRRGKNHSVHRYVYQSLVGEPGALELDHLCRNRACCNPAHLEPVTRKENVNRGIAAEMSRAYHAARTHCPQAHPYSGDNVYVYTGKTGLTQRLCRTCQRDSKRARRAAGKRD